MSIILVIIHHLKVLILIIQIPIDTKLQIPICNLKQKNLLHISNNNKLNIKVIYWLILWGWISSGQMLHLISAKWIELSIKLIKIQKNIK